MHRRVFLLAVTFVLVAPGLALADAIDFGRYELSSHPDGNAAPPSYGLRLDGLEDWDPSRVYTFDFDGPGASMFLDYSAGQIHIFGTAYGGEVDTTADAYIGTPELWTIDFLYDMGVAPKADDSGGAQDLWVTGTYPSDNGANTGSITNGVDTYYLFDYAGGHPFTFRFGDEDDGLGHRGFAGLSGWGWVNHNKDNQYTGVHHSASDWLFTATRVPEPGTLALFGIGAGSLLARRRSTQG